MRIEKAERFWSAPSGTKPQANCGWRVTLCGSTRSHFPRPLGRALQRDVCELKKRTGFGPHPPAQKLKPIAAGEVLFEATPIHFPPPPRPATQRAMPRL